MNRAIRNGSHTEQPSTTHISSGASKYSRSRGSMFFFPVSNKTKHNAPNRNNYFTLSFLRAIKKIYSWEVGWNEPKFTFLQIRILHHRQNHAKSVGRVALVHVLFSLEEFFFLLTRRPDTRRTSNFLMPPSRGAEPLRSGTAKLMGVIFTTSWSRFGSV